MNNEVKIGFEEANVEGRFSDFSVTYLDRTYRKLLKPFLYNDKKYGHITVPKGFVTDYASLGALKNPKLYHVYALLAGYGDRAATVHDYLYQFQNIDGKMVSRKESDKIFFRALRSEGIARWRAYIFYFGVRIGGWVAWDKYITG